MKNKVKLYLLSLSIFLLAYVFYKSEIDYNGNRREYYFIYYIISLFFIICSTIIFFLSNKIFEYVKIIILSFFFFLYIAEIYLINTYKNKFILEFETKRETLNTNKRLYKSMTGKIYDTRSASTVFSNELEKGNEIQVAVPPVVYIKYKNRDIFPLSGVSNIKTLFCNESGYWVYYDSDRYGYSNPDEVWNEKNINILLIGDSYTHGVCVKKNENIASHLIKFSNKPLLNLGYLGNGPLLQYATLREYLPKNVKNVVWLYYEGNDKSELINELKNDFLKNYLNDFNFSQRLKTKQKLIDEINKKEIKLEHEYNKKQKIKEIKLYNKLKTNFSYYAFVRFIKLTEFRVLIYKTQNKNRKNILDMKLITENKIFYENFELILKKTNNLLQNQNTNFIFVYLPEFKRFSKKYNNNDFLKIKKIVNNIGIKFIDINNGVFSKYINPKSLFLFGADNHYNKEGYLETARYIYKKLN